MQINKWIWKDIHEKLIQRYRLMVNYNSKSFNDE